MADEFTAGLASSKAMLFEAVRRVELVEKAALLEPLHKTRIDKILDVELRHFRIAAFHHSLNVLPPVRGGKGIAFEARGHIAIALFRFLRADPEPSADEVNNSAFVQRRNPPNQSFQNSF